MTFEEFLEKCREKDGWTLRNSPRSSSPRWGGFIRNRQGQCPLAAVFGDSYLYEGEAAGLPTRAIASAADGYTDGEYRKALLTLVKP